MSLRAWVRVGWLALAADVVYWFWQLGRSEDHEISTWHAVLNGVLYFGGGVFFVVLIILSLFAWRE